MCSTARVVLFDNYDSYVYNLYQAVGELTGTEATVFRNDRVTLGEVVEARPTHIILSPGPGNPSAPKYFGVCLDVIRELGPDVPILGVCLGHQGIAHAFGGRVVRAPWPMHGKVSRVRHDGSALFAGIDSPFEAMRYHSLVIDPDSVPKCLRVTASTEDGIVMAVAHREYPVLGVQFHPESIGTPAGRRLLRNFLE